MGTLQFADLQTRPTEVLRLTGLTGDEFPQLVSPFLDQVEIIMPTRKPRGRALTCSQRAANRCIAVRASSTSTAVSSAVASSTTHTGIGQRVFATWPWKAASTKPSTR